MSVVGRPISLKIESGVSGYEEKGPNDRPIAITTNRELYTIPDEWLKHRMTEYNERKTAKNLRFGVLYTEATIAVLKDYDTPLAKIAEDYLFNEKQIERCKFLDNEWKKLLRNDRRGVIETHGAKVNDDHFRMIQASKRTDARRTAQLLDKAMFPGLPEVEKEKGEVS